MIKGLWLADMPLVLASGSTTRRDMLAAAGIPVEASPAAIDEREVDRAARCAGAPAATVAMLLARAKAMEVSARYPGRLVLGADQTLACEGRQYDKPADMAQGKAHLNALSGRTHHLHSAAALIRDGRIVGEAQSSADLTMRHLGADFIDAYAAAVGPKFMMSVGGYQLEGLGSQLFERIDGDYFTILGLPLLPLMGHLRAAGYMAE
ncbi:Maf family protein [Camelimonas lactis]|uniref:Nucleoside triphosphate pyrophosphatase n=2 Tax=Camelimonas lactis TaxID=659006 RepID=A0A4R2GV29_9HYPH|nr:Maf family protein [Camelimonas lactis]TCO14679.1 septum formation protein [Camelimonas lactis]